MSDYYGPPKPPPEPPPKLPPKVWRDQTAEQMEDWVLNGSKPELNQPKEWWQFVRDERMAKTGDGLTMWTEYLGTDGGRIMSGFDAKSDETPGGFVPPVELGDSHPLWPGLIAAQIDVRADMNEPITVRVKWVGGNGVCVDPLEWDRRPVPKPPDPPENVSALTGAPWRKRRRPVHASPKRGMVCHKCGVVGVRTREAVPGRGLWCEACVDRRGRRHFAWRAVASIGGLVLYAGAVWLYASSV